MTKIQGNFRLLMKRAHMLASNDYLACADFEEKVVWHQSGNGHVLCSCPKAIDDGAMPIAVLLVAVPSMSNWYNKLSSLGDYDEQYPRGAFKLKWLLHVGAPSGTIFMEDWERGISTLRYLQQHVSTGEPKDMTMMMKTGNRTELRLRANVFKKRNNSQPVDDVTSKHTVSWNHHDAYNKFIVDYSLDTIDIRDIKGVCVPMGVGAEKAVGGSLCLLSFQASTTLFVSKESFNVVLQSVKVLILNTLLAKTIGDTQASLGAELKAANVFGPVEQAVSLHGGIDKDVKCPNGKDDDGEHSYTVNEDDREHSNAVHVAAPIDNRKGDVLQIEVVSTSKKRKADEIS
ncbi:hypothetical protein ARMSODRAFT_1027298 [Armillaria solidipes]|uniref:Uncharacterized protein n=1 Tax=Armillaria solidipes TaxID=1076256 RepID=A0A2H3AKY7_9AGAR|nr:hypothetical protein ARMSODRAFT_1027298 [Armillaria solidipes]